MNGNGLAGMPIGDVIAAVADGDDRDPDTVRAALDPVAEDGVVTRAAVETTVSDTSKLVATAETRVELAGIAYDDATAAAEPVDDLAVVAARLDAYRDRLADVERQAADLTDDLRAPVFDDPDAVYELAVDLRAVAGNAQAVARRADELSFDLEGFEAWLGSPDRRYDELGEDVDLVEESLEELSTVAAALPGSETPAVDWADATMRARVLSLLVADLRAELTDLRTWADREGGAFRAGFAKRVESTERRVAELLDTLDERADPAWRDRFGADLAAFAEDLAAFEPPVDWDRVQGALEARREDAFDRA